MPLLKSPNVWKTEVLLKASVHQSAGHLRSSAIGP
jgi:hypothetical protein